MRASFPRLFANHFRQNLKRELRPLLPAAQNPDLMTALCLAPSQTFVGYMGIQGVALLLQRLLTQPQTQQLLGEGQQFWRALRGRIRRR